MNNTLLIEQAITNSTLDKTLEYHTYKEWLDKGYQVQKGEKSVLKVQLWKKYGAKYVQGPAFLFSSKQVKLNRDEPIEVKSEPKEAEPIDQDEMTTDEPKNIAKELKEILNETKDEPKTIDIDGIELPELPKKRKASPKEAAIKRFLKKVSSNRKELRYIHKQDEMIEFTDSYAYFKIHDFENELPYTDDDMSYPNCSSLIKKDEPKKRFTMNADVIKTVHKTIKQLKENAPKTPRYEYDELNNRVLINVGDNETQAWLNSFYLVNMIDILGFTKYDMIEFEYYGPLKPIHIKKGEELALISTLRVKG